MTRAKTPTFRATICLDFKKRYRLGDLCHRRSQGRAILCSEMGCDGDVTEQAVHGHRPQPGR